MGILFAVAAVAILALAGGSSSTKKTTGSGTGGTKEPGKTPTSTTSTALKSASGQLWTAISPFVKPGLDMAVGVATGTGLKFLASPISTAGALLGSEVLLILQGSVKRADQIAKPVIAVSGKVLGFDSKTGVPDTVRVAVDSIVNVNSDAAKLSASELPNMGTIAVPATVIASTGA